jgi:hypothetical protein
MYNVFPIFESIVTAIHFAVRVLIIGLDCGKYFFVYIIDQSIDFIFKLISSSLKINYFLGDVFLFSVENEAALNKIDFKTKNSKRIHIDCEPIVSVNIMEISGDQRLLVATKYTIYHMKLDSIVS